MKDPVHPGRELIKLLDFGIAKLESKKGEGGDTKTRNDALMGTPGYMAPEQYYGAEHVDPRADVYSLGVMLYQMLTGHLPFVGTGVFYGQAKPVRKERPEVSRRTADLVHRMLAREPEQRPSLAEVIAGLAPEAVAARPSRITAGVAGLLVVICACVAISGFGIGLHLRRAQQGGQPADGRTTVAGTAPSDPAGLRALAVRVIEEALADVTPERRAAAVGALAQTHDVRHRPLVSERLRKDRDPRVQQVAAEALAQIGARQEVPALLEVARGRARDEIWLAAVRALYLLAEKEASPDGARPADAEARRLLSELLRSGDMTVRKSVALVLSRSEEEARRILRVEYEAYKQLPNASLPTAGRAILFALAEARDAPAEAALTERLRTTGAPDAAQVDLAQFLASRGSHAGQRILEQVAKAPGGGQIPAIHALVGLGDLSGCEQLRGVLADAQAVDGLRALAADGLGDCGTLADARALAPRLLAGAEPSPTVRLSLAGAILRMLRRSAAEAELVALGLYDEWGPGAASVSLLGTMTSVEALRRLIGLAETGGTPELRTLAAGQLRGISERLTQRGVAIDPGLLQRLKSLRGGLHSLEPVARRLAVEATSDPAALRQALDDPALPVRLAAALRDPSPRANEVLREALAQPPPESLLAYGALARRGVAVPPPKDPAALLRVADEGQRAAAVHTLAEWPAAAARPLLEIAARDPSPRVRREAAQVAAIEAEREPALAEGLAALFAGENDALAQAQIERILLVHETAPVPRAAEPTAAAAPGADLGASSPAPVSRDGGAPADAAMSDDPLAGVEEPEGDAPAAAATPAQAQSQAQAQKAAPRAKVTRPPPKMNVTATLTAASRAYQGGSYMRAIALARGVTKVSPHRAWRIIGSAACGSRNLALASEALRRLDAAGRQYLKYVCQKRGIHPARGNPYRFVR